MVVERQGRKGKQRLACANPAVGGRGRQKAKEGMAEPTDPLRSKGKEDSM